MTARWLPYPRMSLGLLILWLLLNQSLDASHIALGIILAILAPLTLKTLEVPRTAVRRPAAIVRLGRRVLIDITRSNIAVARIILQPAHTHLTSGFVTIPLTLRNPNGLAALACIITATPGTIWVHVDPRAGLLMIHVLDLIDENAWIATIKNRYESLLLEIFE
jgi:multicomponent K+:H+ antiporter subunit E